MPPKQPKKGKGKKVTVTDPTSAPAAPPNPEVQPVLDAHIANVGSEHFPAGYFPIPYTLTSPDAESFVPFVNRPFESEIHGTVNFTQFCCVLLVTWCYRVLLSCYLRPK